LTIISYQEQDTRLAGHAQGVTEDGQANSRKYTACSNGISAFYSDAKSSSGILMKFAAGAVSRRCGKQHRHLGAMDLKIAANCPWVHEADRSCRRTLRDFQQN